MPARSVIKKPYGTHRPGEPTSETPPPDLVALAENLHHPQVRTSGITCTEDGRWALYVTVSDDAPVPLPEVEAAAAGLPVVYEGAAPGPAEAY
ncbi:hypothetical protein [Roseimicrobium sp. ORNL1]|uniref:hypothetical protein n=1 Tax=Roseimicrobium sp. ORNL1 TaxID=2711231 RepID=UPI0013E12215|nr:hypothetical protein [Roseimicrobium sp. ORNL1]QIF02014.1 hypothetical protein G5S37_10885 [Roseimicrobium sp. ORNL1]